MVGRFMYLWVFPSKEYSFWPHFLLLSFIIFVILSAMAYGISIVDYKKDTEDKKVLDFGAVLRPTSKVRMLWFFPIIVMVGLYVLFNGH